MNENAIYRDLYFHLLTSTMQLLACEDHGGVAWTYSANPADWRKLPDPNCEACKLMRDMCVTRRMLEG